MSDALANDDTAENVLREVLIRIGLDRPDAQVNDPDYEMRRVMAAIHGAGDELVRRADWPLLVRDDTRIRLLEGIITIDLPEHCDRLVTSGPLGDHVGTHYLKLSTRVQRDFVQGRFVAEEALKSYYYQEGRRVTVYAARRAGLGSRTTTIRYVSGHWVGGKAGAPGMSEEDYKQTQRRITKPSDRMRVPAELVMRGAVWRWKRAMGLGYDDELAEFEAALAETARVQVDT